MTWELVSRDSFDPSEAARNTWPPVAIPEPLRVLAQDYGGTLYMILDAARVFGCVERLESSRLQHVCIYGGNRDEDWREAAPWLTELREDNTFCHSLLTSGRKGDPNALLSDEPGIVVLSKDPIEKVRAHFRKFTKVQDEDGLVMLLRFYDPQTLADLLAVLPPDQAARLHGNHMLINVRADGSFTASRATTQVTG